jgi:hypothetical protein
MGSSHGDRALMSGFNLTPANGLKAMRLLNGLKGKSLSDLTRATVVDATAVLGLDVEDDLIDKFMELASMESDQSADLAAWIEQGLDSGEFTKLLSPADADKNVYWRCPHCDQGFVLNQEE